MKLYTWKTPNGQKPLIAIQETGLACEVIAVNLGQGQQRDPEYLALNPNGKIPTLVEDDGTVIVESGAILWHIAEKSEQLLPRSRDGQAKVRQWLFWEASNLGPAVVHLGHFLFRDERIPYPIDRFADLCVRFVSVLDATLRDADYVANQYSIADIALYPFVQILWKPLAGIRPGAVAESRHVERWLQRMAERPAVNAAMTWKF